LESIKGGGDKMFTKKDLKSGKHWVETKDGGLGCVMENWIVFKDINIHINNYDENFICKIKPNYNLVRILKLKSTNYIGYFAGAPSFDVVVEINQLKPITSLDQLEKVRKEMCEKYNGKFYITNESEEWEIRTADEKYYNEHAIYGEGSYPFDIKVDLEKEGYRLEIL